MGVLLMILFITLFVMGLFHVFNNDRDRKISMVTTGILGFVVIFIVSMGTLFDSYNNAVNLEATYNGCIAQYKSAVTMYEKKAVIDISDAALTDFKYEGYQQTMGAFIADLRQQVTQYNKNLITKRKYATGFPYGILIVDAPAKLKVIELVE